MRFDVYLTQNNCDAFGFVTECKMLIPLIILITLFSAEFVVLARIKRGFKMAASVSLVLLFVFITLNVMFNTPSYVIEDRFVLVVLGSALLYGTPIVLFLLLCWLQRNKDETTLHKSAVLFSIGNALVFPFLSLIYVCTLGIDCI